MTFGGSTPAPRIREAGDSALLLELGLAGAEPRRGVIDVDVNAYAVALARAVWQRGIRGLRDVTPTFRSVAVFFDPLVTDSAAVAADLDEACAMPAVDQTGTVVEVPVVYGGDAGPDLAAVAAFAGCRPQEVIERHASRTYRVFMLGFLPGFPYMAPVDETIAAPRRAAPRVRVPAGSVGIAGRQTGIYPRESPGGWQIIGRTSLQLFDPARTPPALFVPGDMVRFVPVAPDVVSGFGRTQVRLKADRTINVGTRSVTVLRPGLLTTIQDTGRWGHQSLGVPVSGPMDPVAHRLANALVGNAPDAATLEATLVGPELRFEQQTRIAIAGADLRPTVGPAEVPMHAAVMCSAGSVLRFGDRRSGARAYIAFDGGVAVRPVLGSRATHLFSGLGGIEGRALKAGDRVLIGAPAHAGSHLKVPPYTNAVGPSSGGARLRILPGPQSDCFSGPAFDVLQHSRYTISPQSDRMGYRLTGGAPVPSALATEMISDAAFIGGLQVPASGQPILLMADRPTTGGYPHIAVVITADLPLAAQLAPGDWVEFEICSRSDAIAALRAQEGQFVDLG